MHVAVIGDSIVHGGIDPEYGGWVARLKIRSMADKRGDHVFALGLGGNTSRQALARAQAELSVRTGHVRNVIYGLDTNDMNRGVPPAEFQANLAALAAIGKLNGLKVHFMGLFLRTDRDAAAETAAYDSAIRAVCADGGHTYIPTADVITADDLPDGVHPNAAGHAKLCARAAEFLHD